MPLTFVQALEDDIKAAHKRRRQIWRRLREEGWGRSLALHQAEECIRYINIELRKAKKETNGCTP